MKKRLGGWSLNLEDSHYAEHPQEMLAESVQAVAETSSGHYVNLVTPEEAGDPRDSFIDQLAAALLQHGVAFARIDYVSQCGCGGHVVRVYK